MITRFKRFIALMLCIVLECAAVPQISSADTVHLPETLGENNPIVAQSVSEFDYTTISGRVLDEGGSGIENVVILLVNLEEGNRLVCRTDSLGYWQTNELEIVSTYSYRVNYSKAGYTFNTNEITVTAAKDGNDLGTVIGVRRDDTGYVCNPEDYTYTTTETAATITGYTGSDAKLMLPETLGGVPVTGIGGSAFKNKTGITAVWMPDTVVSIGTYAFQGCSSIEEIECSGALESIGRYAFNNCTGLKRAELPDGVTSIGQGAYEGCSALEYFRYPKSLTSAGYHIFNNCRTLTTITVPEGVTVLPANVFDTDNGAYLKEIVLPKTLESIGNYAFYGCSGLESIEIPENVTSIGRYAFNNCTGLKRAELPDGVTSIGQGAYEGCSALEYFKYPKSLTSAGYHIFNNCRTLTTITVPEGVTVLPANVFDTDNGAYLKEIVLPKTLESIGNYAFYGCSGLESIEIPENVTSIGRYAFNNCTGLKRAELPDGVTSIGQGAYEGCSALEYFKYPKSLTSAGYHIFNNCRTLTTITVPEGVTALPASVFDTDNGAYLKEIVLPKTLESIGNYAFCGCSELESIEIPENVTSIGRYAFNNCTGLKHVELPDGVTSIGQGAYEGCSTLVSINYPKSLTKTGSGIFKNCTALKSIDVPEGVTALPQDVFSQANGLRIVTLPDTLTEIGAYAFNGCSNLRYIRIPASVRLIGRDAFNNCHSTLIFYVCKSSYAAIYAVDNGFHFVVEGTESIDDDIFSNAGTAYYAFTDSLSINGCVSMTLQYCLNDEIADALSKMKLHLLIPDGSELLDATLNFNGNIVTDYSIDGGKLTVPVSGKSGTLHFSVKFTSSIETLISYAYMSYSAFGTNDWSSIDFINEDISVLTIDVPETTSMEELKVSGNAPKSATVILSLDGTEVGSMIATKKGDYSFAVSLREPENNSVHSVQVTALTQDGSSLTTSRTFRYKVDNPVIDQFLMYYNNHQDTSMDMLDPNSENNIVYFNPAYPMTFTLKINNSEGIDRVFVTSTRNNTKRSIEAFYDASRGLYVASGYFDENQHNYVPGAIGVEYIMKHRSAKVSDSIDTSIFAGMTSSNSTVKQVDDHTTVATIDMSEFIKEFAKVNLKATLQYYNHLNGKDIDDVTGFEIGGKVLSYVLPGVDGERYYAKLDLSNPKTYVMVVADGIEVADTVYSLVLDATEFSDENFLKMDDLGNTISNVSTVATTIYEMYGIYEDHDKLLEEINTSSTITNKAEAIRKAEELRDNRIAFLLLTTALPMLTIGSPMTVPAIMFTALIGMMSATSSVFTQLRVADIKGENLKLPWALDPSGYVYEAVTANRLQGVQASAYWVEYDENNEEFWDTVPPEGAGVLWDASEWNQTNPMITDTAGRYQWDVPEGWWQVRFKKDGYEDAQSAWLSVAPPQTDITIPMISYEAPVFEYVNVYENRIELKSSRYLDPQTISAISLTDHNGAVIDYTAQWPQDEMSADGTIYAKEFTLFFDSITLAADEALTLNVPEESVFSYSGVAMAALSESVSCTVEQEILIDDEILLYENTQTTFEATITNHRITDSLNVVSSSQDVVKVVSVSPVDEDGKVAVCLEGVFTGAASIMLSIAGSNIRKVIPVTVSLPIWEKTKGDYHVVVNRTRSGITGYTIESMGDTDVNIVAAAAVYSDSSMTHLKLDDVITSETSPGEIALNWAGLPAGAVLKIMLLSSDTYSPVTEPFIFNG